MAPPSRTIIFLIQVMAMAYRHQYGTMFLGQPILNRNRANSSEPENLE